MGKTLLRVGDIIRSDQFVYGYEEFGALVLDGDPYHIVNRPLTGIELDEVARARGFKNGTELRERAEEFMSATGHFAEVLCRDVNVTNFDEARRKAEYIIVNMSGGLWSLSSGFGGYGWSTSNIILYVRELGGNGPELNVIELEDLFALTVTPEGRKRMITEDDVEVVGRAVIS